jgi:O-antigen/teichoic acid export membrane protein
MPSSGFALWKGRALRLWLTAAASAVGAIGGIARNKWLALHLDPAGFGVLGQVVAGQVWLGTLTGLGLGIPVTQAIGAAVARGDTPAVRRTISTALTAIAACALVVATLGLIAAPWIAVALLGSSEHAGLVRISMIAVAGLAFQGTVQGLFAGYSDVRPTLTYAIFGNVTVVGLVMLLVPRFELSGAIWSLSFFWPASILFTLLIHRRAYAEALAPPAGPRFDRTLAAAMLKVAFAGLALALLEQGTLLTLRSHYVRTSGLGANGLLQASLALSQQIGAVFYSYLGAYAFGKISGMTGAEGVRAYTRKQWVPLAGLAALALAAVMLASGPMLHILYSSRFDPARPMLAWMLVGEFARVCVQIWALGALPLGGVRLWFPIGLAGTIGMPLVYIAARALGAGTMSLPYAYGGAHVLSLAFTAAAMSRRGVTLGARDLALLAVALGGLAALAFALTR